ncbi:hypothetical protein [Vitiosangium sp. GDMCC 1.1324]|uniref:hypothetical protein n=1 Tax=Vitiosangium sp. (strain GDMCC 1.1324) TaxID=2138576 RepID=UPI0011B613D4|nr:hypothetical protein [Vitiosangium sp. GDMCC 1.1324]
MRSAPLLGDSVLAAFLLVGCAAHQQAGAHSHVGTNERHVDVLVDAIDVGQSTKALPTRFADASGRARPDQVQLAMAGTLPSGPSPKCTEILGKIMSFLFGSATNILGGVTLTGIDMHRGLLGRHEDLLQDKENLYNKYRSKSTPHPDGKGSWDGHVDQYNEQQTGLSKLLQQWNNPRNGCNGDGGSGLPQERFQIIQLAAMWAAEQAPSQPRPKSAPAAASVGLSPVSAPAPAPTLSLAPAPTTQSNGPSTERIVKALKILGVSTALVVIVAVAVLDPEPVSKLTLAGLSVQQAATLLLLLGITAEITTTNFRPPARRPAQGS